MKMNISGIKHRKLTEECQKTEDIDDDCQCFFGHLHLDDVPSSRATTSSRAYNPGLSSFLLHDYRSVFVFSFSISLERVIKYYFPLRDVQR